MKVWAEHQRSTGETIVKCPLCRVDFGTFQVSGSTVSDMANMPPVNFWNMHVEFALGSP